MIVADDTPTEVAERAGSSVDGLPRHNESVSNPDLIFAGDTLRLEGRGAEDGPTGGDTYDVRSGDTLSEISQKKGTSVEHLVASNPEISDPDLIHPGQTLRL